jgi:N-acetylmuramoyl-L-alanine amidase
LFNAELSARARRGSLAIALALLAVLAAASGALAQDALPSVLAARVSTTPQRARLVLDLSASTDFALASLAGPERIAIDVKADAVKIDTPQAVAGQGIVSAFTVTEAEPGRARAELTLSQPAVVQQAYVLDPVGDQPARLVVDFIATTESDFEAHVAADLASAMARAQASGTSDLSEPTPSSAPGEESAASSAELTTPAAQAPPAAAPKAGATNVPVSQSKPLIVLDPGHGGIDNGASAPNGDREKDITLAFTLQLRDWLVASGKFDVALTRNDDTYLTLNQRVTLARQNHADLFISLHADTFQAADIRGASIYTRDEHATDILDKVLADGENRADIVSGYVPATAKPAVIDLLVDLMRRQARQHAFLAAEDIVKAMEPNVALRRFPVRQADFFVLQAPDVPSILIELGFLSNSADIANLENTDWRTKMVETVGQGVESYFADLGSSQ